MDVPPSRISTLVKLRRTRSSRSARTAARQPELSSWQVRVISGRVDSLEKLSGLHELSGVLGVPSSARALRCSSVRFQGRNPAMAAGAWPPASAQLVKYHCSHLRGFNFHSFNVAKIE